MPQPRIDPIDWANQRREKLAKARAIKEQRKMGEEVVPVDGEEELSASRSQLSSRGGGGNGSRRNSRSVRTLMYAEDSDEEEEGGMDMGSMSVGGMGAGTPASQGSSVSVTRHRKASAGSTKRTGTSRKGPTPPPGARSRNSSAGRERGEESNRGEGMVTGRGGSGRAGKGTTSGGGGGGGNPTSRYTLAQYYEDIEKVMRSPSGTGGSNGRTQSRGGAGGQSTRGGGAGSLASQYEAYRPNTAATQAAFASMQGHGQGRNTHTSHGSNPGNLSARSYFADANGGHSTGQGETRANATQRYKMTYQSHIQDEEERAAGHAGLGSRTARGSIDSTHGDDGGFLLAGVGDVKRLDAELAKALLGALLKEEPELLPSLNRCLLRLIRTHVFKKHEEGGGGGGNGSMSARAQSRGGGGGGVGGPLASPRRGGGRPVTAAGGLLSRMNSEQGMMMRTQGKQGGAGGQQGMGGQTSSGVQGGAGVETKRKARSAGPHGTLEREQIRRRNQEALQREREQRAATEAARTSRRYSPQDEDEEEEDGDDEDEEAEEQEYYQARARRQQQEQEQEERRQQRQREQRREEIRQRRMQRERERMEEEEREEQERRRQEQQQQQQQQKNQHRRRTQMAMGPRMDDDDDMREQSVDSGGDGGGYDTRGPGRQTLSPEEFDDVQMQVSRDASEYEELKAMQGGMGGRMNTTTSTSTTMMGEEQPVGGGGGGRMGMGMGMGMGGMGGMGADDDMDEEMPSEPMNRVECPECGRKFAEERLAKHAKVCKKVFQTKRKQFDVTKMRVQGTDAAKYVHKAKAAKQEKKPTKKKNSKWRREHEEFVNQLRAGRGAPPIKTGGGSVMPEGMDDGMPKDDGLTPCPHCGRTFNETAAEKHIPICAKVRNKPKRLQRKR